MGVSLSKETVVLALQENTIVSWNLINFEFSLAANGREGTERKKKKSKIRHW